MQNVNGVMYNSYGLQNVSWTMFETRVIHIRYRILVRLCFCFFHSYKMKNFSGIMFLSDSFTLDAEC